VADDPLLAPIAGVIPDWIELPGGNLGAERIVRISREGMRHVAFQRPEWVAFCLRHMAAVLSTPEYLGYRPRLDPRRIEFARSIEGEGRLLLVAVKFLDDKHEAWVCTAHPMEVRFLTRRLRAGTMAPLGRGP